MKRLYLSATLAVVVMASSMFLTGSIVAKKRSDARNLQELQQARLDYKESLEGLNNAYVHSLQELEDKHNKALQSIVEKRHNSYHVDNFVISAYSPYDNVSGIENNGDADATSTGQRPGPGVFAVDPDVIPYYSTVVIIYKDGTVLRGIAGDCGGAIKGNRIDVYKDTYGETTKHGMKDATVIWWS